MTPSEKIAADTWERLKLSRDLRVRLGEETLTDLLALDFTRSMKDNARLFQCTKPQESVVGTDLWILIYAGSNRALAFAVQAKKLYPSNRYEHLNARVKSSGPFQIDILEEFSGSVGAIPLYLLYNHADLDDTFHYWHCCQCADKGQLGCTLVPSWIIREAISNRGHRDFNSIHASCAALPWRCLFDCPEGRSHRMLPAARRSLSRTRKSLRESWAHTRTELPLDDARNYDWVRFEPVDGGWPKWLWSRDGGAIHVEEFGRIRAGISSQDAKISELENKDMSGFPAAALPRHLILVKEKTR